MAFSSEATNLVPNDTNGVRDFFVRDRLRGSTEIMLYRPIWNLNGGRQRIGRMLSANGRYFGFGTNFPLSAADCCANGDAYLYDRSKGAASCVSINDNEEGDEYAGLLQVTSDARFVTFASAGAHLVAGDTNGVTDVFIRDRKAPRSTQRVSVTATGGQLDGDSASGRVSDDGKVVAFSSSAPNLIPGSLEGPPNQTQAYVLLR